MLNETWCLWQALQKTKNRIDIPHPLIKPLPVSEKNLLRVRLNEEGHVTSVEDIANDERTGIWRIVQTSDGSFPVIKVNLPFLNLPSESSMWVDLSKEKDTNLRIDLMGKAFAAATQRPWEDAGWKWSNSLEKSNLLAERLSADARGGIIALLGQSFKKALQTKDAFITEMAEVALTQLRTGRLDAEKTLQELLVGKGKDNRGKDKKISVLLVLDLDKGGSVYQRYVSQAVSDVSSDQSICETKKSQACRCCLCIRWRGRFA